MILKIASYFIFAFVAFNLFFRSGCGVAVKIIGTIFIFCVSQKYLIYEVFGGAFFCPDLPRWFILLMECLYGSLIILFFLLLFWDIYLAGNWILRRSGMPVPARLPTGYIRLGLAALALGLGVWATAESVAVPRIKNVVVRIANLPAALDGFRIAQLSDLHVGPILNREWTESVVNKVNAENPDLIALTGDFIDGRVSVVLPEIEPLAGLKAKYGVFGVTGNHEYYWNADEWIRAIKSLNVRMLNNEREVVKVGDHELQVVGLPDLAAGNFGAEPPDLSKALDGAPRAVRVLLAHQPRYANAYARHVDLHLAGHTHGGIIFFLQPLIAKFNSGFVKGLYPLGDSSLYVSSGTGIWNGFSFRFGVPAEITLITLKPL